MDYSNIIKLNQYASKDINDVRHFLNVSVKHIMQSGGITEYYGLGEAENLDKWKYPNFNYSFNSLGFRMEECKSEYDIAAFGCSFTFGQGLPTNMIYHQNLGKNVANFGIPGTSIQTIFDIFCIIANHIKFDKAIFLLPPLERIQIAKIYQDELDFVSLVPNLNDYYKKVLNLDSDEILRAVPEEELIKDFKNTLYATQIFAKSKNITMYIQSWDPKLQELLKDIVLDNVVILPKWSDSHQRDRARDQRHPGPATHQNWADQIRPYFN